MMTELDLSSSIGPSPPSITLARFNGLVSVLEDLLKRIADTEDPHIRRLRAKVRAELVAIYTDIYGPPAAPER
jgi:hypothetical protein